MSKEQIPRIDGNEEIRKLLLPYCRLKYGEVWNDSVLGHKVGCLDAANDKDILKLMGNDKAILAIQDPPYNVIVGNNNTNNLGKISLGKYIDLSKHWVQNTTFIYKTANYGKTWKFISSDI